MSESFQELFEQSLQTVEMNPGAIIPHVAPTPMSLWMFAMGALPLDPLG